MPTSNTPLSALSVTCVASLYNVRIDDMHVYNTITIDDRRTVAGCPGSTSAYTTHLTCPDILTRLTPTMPVANVFSMLAAFFITTKNILWCKSKPPWHAGLSFVSLAGKCAGSCRKLWSFVGLLITVKCTVMPIYNCTCMTSSCDHSTYLI